MKDILQFIKQLKFRYSIVILLLGSLMFLVMFPSFNHSISDQHWSIINQTIGAVEVFLGYAIKHYFDKKDESVQSNVN